MKNYVFGLLITIFVSTFGVSAFAETTLMGTCSAFLYDMKTNVSSVAHRVEVEMNMATPPGTPAMPNKVLADTNSYQIVLYWNQHMLNIALVDKTQPGASPLSVAASKPLTPLLSMISNAAQTYQAQASCTTRTVVK